MNSILTIIYLVFVMFFELFFAYSFYIYTRLTLKALKKTKEFSIDDYLSVMKKKMTLFLYIYLGVTAISSIFFVYFLNVVSNPNYLALVGIGFAIFIMVLILQLVFFSNIKRRLKIASSEDSKVFKANTIVITAIFHALIIAPVVLLFVMHLKEMLV